MMAMMLKTEVRRSSSTLSAMYPETTGCPAPAPSPIAPRPCPKARSQKFLVVAKMTSREVAKTAPNNRNVFRP